MNPDELLTTDRGIDALVVPVLAVMVVGLLFFLPKIYVANSIYLTSLEIEGRKSALLVLQDENRALKKEVEVSAFELENP
jgi:hypothetical protein